MIDSKIVICGSFDSEKRDILLRATSDYYKSSQTTIGAQKITKVVDLNDTKVRLELWDTSGQEKYRSLAPMYYRNCAVIILVFSLIDQNSFNFIKDTVSEMSSNVEEMPKLFLVGNRVDLVDERCITTEQGEKYADEIDAYYMEVSSKTGYCIDDLFYKVAMESISKNSPPKKYKLVIKSIKSQLNFKNLTNLGIEKPCFYIKFGIKNDSTNVKRTKSISNDLNPVWNQAVELKINDMKTDILKVSMFSEQSKSDKKLMNDIEIPISNLKKFSQFEEDIKMKKKEAGHLSFTIKILNQLQKDDDDEPEKKPIDADEYEIKLSEITNEYQLILANQSKEHAIELEKKVKEYEAKLANQSKEHAIELEKKVKEYEAKLANQSKEHEIKPAKKVKEYEAESTNQSKEHVIEPEKKVKEYESESANQSKEHAIELEKKVKEYEAKLANQSKEHAIELEKKSKEIQEMQQKMHELIESHDKEIHKFKEEKRNNKIKDKIEEPPNQKITSLGSTDIEKYEKIEKLGSGGGGEVYKVALKKFYAMKIMKSDEINISKFRHFVSEYEIMNMLNHPNILKTYGIFFSDEKTPPSIILEFCPNSLDKAIKNGSLSNIDIVKSIYQIVEGMKYVHFRKVIHRDLKPQNILIADDGTIKISDFGISKLMSLEEQLTTLGIGTQKYMAPEIHNEQDYDEKADVYSFGVLLFNVLSNGNLPKITIPQIGNGKKAEIPNSFTQFAHELIDSCWNFDPKDRPSFSEIDMKMEENKYNLLPLSDIEIKDIITFVKNFKSKIPSYSS